MSIIKIDDDTNYIPFDKYGIRIDGILWRNISYDKITNHGSYILKFEKDIQSIPHIHEGYEEFLILEGEIKDSNGDIYKKGDFVTYGPNTHHSVIASQSTKILVFMRGFNRIV